MPFLPMLFSLVLLCLMVILFKLHWNFMLTQLEKQGYIFRKSIISNSLIRLLKDKINQYIIKDSEYGFRQLEKKIPFVYQLANSQEIINIIKDSFQNQPKLVRSIYFNKTLNANWGVSWHQDKVIAVKKK